MKISLEIVSCQNGYHDTTAANFGNTLNITDTCIHVQNNEGINLFIIIFIQIINQDIYKIYYHGFVNWVGGFVRKYTC